MGTVSGVCSLSIDLEEKKRHPLTLLTGMHLHADREQ